MLVLVAGLEGVAADDPGEVDLGVEQGGILELRIGGLTAEGAKASADGGGGNAAGDSGIGRKTGEAEAGILADGERELAGLGAREAKAGIEQLVGSNDAGPADGDLLIQNALLAVGVAVDDGSEEREVGGVLLEIADPDEEGVLGIGLEVEPQGSLVGEVLRSLERGVVVDGGSGGVGREDAENGARDGGDVGRGQDGGPGSVGGPGVRSYTVVAKTPLR